jgi:serine/threonine protein kinase
MVGKPIEEIKLRKLMKQKLQTTSIPDLEFEDAEGNFIKFDTYYDYHKFLGCGSFGFVVSAVDRESGEHVALKVICDEDVNFYFRLWTQAVRAQYNA